MANRSTFVFVSFFRGNVRTPFVPKLLFCTPSHPRLIPHRDPAATRGPPGVGGWGWGWGGDLCFNIPVVLTDTWSDMGHSVNWGILSRFYDLY